MADATATLSRPLFGRRSGLRRLNTGTAFGVGLATLWLSLLVLIPLGAVVWRAQEDGLASFWDAATAPEAAAAIRLTVASALIVALINAVLGTLIAWVLVRDDFRGKRVVDALIDLPFALPTIVAGLVLLTLYGVNSPVGVQLAYTRAGVVVALLFVTLPFVVRTVQPVLLELDVEMEQAATSLGASKITTFRRIVLPNLAPAISAGTALAFARGISEFGATVLISNNLPFKTQVASVYIFGQIEADNTVGAAAVATVLLLIAIVVLFGLDLLQRWAARHA
ncbi:MAG TPA: sulfate ABC transporter permease subunit CysT [Ilumatobacteraceae bacterium]|nr:sulfate ABC transporter permease subunit CysT [Ilumatobacteraceae bacterium]